jgi:hypothetical protein
MTMDAMGAPADAGAPAQDSGDAGQKRYAQAIAALELASGSPEAIAAADGADSFSVTFDGDDAIVSVGDVDVTVTADQIAGEVGEEMTEIDDMPDPAETSAP